MLAIIDSLLGDQARTRIQLGIYQPGGNSYIPEMYYDKWAGTHQFG